jgi:protein-tyrosine-phosphatase
MKKILFVCTGNTCRSSTAQEIFNNLIKKQPKIADKYIAESAGICAKDGDSASVHSIDIAKILWDYDLNFHKSRRLTNQIIENSNLILTMTTTHKNEVIKMLPQAKGKTFTLGEYSAHRIDHKNFAACQQLDIPDPCGQSQHAYLQCGLLIRNYIEVLIKKLSEIDI